MCAYSIGFPTDNVIRYRFASGGIGSMIMKYLL